MKNYITILLLALGTTCFAQNSKLSVNVGINYGTPLNQNLRNLFGYNLGLGYKIGEKSNLVLNYNNLNNLEKSSSLKWNTHFLTVGYQQYLTKKKNIYVIGEFGTQVGSGGFLPTIGTGFGYEKRLSNRVSLDLGTKFYYTKNVSINNLTWLFNTTLKIRL